MLTYHRVGYDVSYATESELKTKRQSLQWVEASALNYCAKDVSLSPTRKQGGHFRVRPHIAA